MTIHKKGMELVQFWHRFDEHTNGWVGMVVGAAIQATKFDSVITAAAIAYYSLFSLFPLILLSISISSFYLGPLMDQQVTLQKLEFIAPALSQLIGKNIDEIIRVRGQVTGFALIGLIWAASTVFYTLTHTLTGIWGIKHRRPVWKRRGLSILFVLAFVGPVLFLASFAGSLIANLQTLLPVQIIPFGGIVSFAVATLLDIALFMVVYILLPHGQVTWHEIIPGAVGAGLLWEFAKKAFLYFVASYISISNLVYGSLATIIGFLVWAYLSSLIFLFGAFLNVAYFERKQSSENPLPKK
jgi:membrane protein